MKLTTRSAALCTFLVPGLAHFLLGRPLRAAIAFVSCVGLFFAGYAILQDRIWFVEMITPGETGLSSWLRLLPITLLPESPNFGCSMLAAFMREGDSPDVLRLLRMPRELEHLGFLLTGSSGILACLWAADAHWLAQDRKASLPPAWAAGLSWILPGAGHVAAGQKSKGMVMGAAVCLMFLLGLLFSAGHAVDRAHYAAWWVGQSFCGGPLILSSLVTAPMKFSEFPAYMDLGVALCTVAGFMNVIVMVDAYTVAEQSGAGGDRE
ncbi:MAG: DUF6677 family protein [Planctomycetota bacterium]|jgi:hypothetical protein